MSITSVELLTLISGYFWPFVRISTMLLSAPVFGARNIVFVFFRLALALALTVIVQPYAGTFPVVEIFSWQGLSMLAEQMLIGLAMGFILQMVFGSLVIAGQSMAMTMGLGFASFVDPSNGVSVPVVSKFYLLMGTLLFFAMDAHLIAIKVLVESFSIASVSQKAISVHDLYNVVLWGSKMYVGALLIALPCMVIITLINIGFGVMTRSAPQMNIFAVGFPIMLAGGIVVMILTLPNLLSGFTDLIMNAFKSIQLILASK